MKEGTSIFDHNTRLKVGHILKTLPETRDCDVALIQESWLLEYPVLARQIKDICNAIKLGHMTLPDTLTRARRDLQLKNSSLRGEIYKTRHQIAEDIRQMYFSFVEDL